MPFNSIGPMELIIVLVIALIVLGPKRLPEVGRSVGRGMREFKGAITGGSDDRDADETAASRPEASTTAYAPAPGRQARRPGAPCLLRAQARV